MVLAGPSDNLTCLESGTWSRTGSLTGALDKPPRPAYNISTLMEPETDTETGTGTNTGGGTGAAPERSPGPAPRGTSARGPRLPVARVLTVLILAAGLAAALTLPGAWRETQRREASLPRLEAQARRDPYDGRLQALLGGRLMEAGEYPAAAAALERGVTIGEKTDLVWLTLASARAASGDARALGYLEVGAKETPSPLMTAALDRCRALGRGAPPLALASAICPQGPEPLVAAYARGSFLNPVSEWRGHVRPEESGFATRQAWAGQRPDDAQAQRLWGQALEENRRYPEAETALERAVALAPASPAAHLALADLLESQSLPAQASLEYIACLKIRRGQPPALLGLGRATLASNLPLASADVFAEAAHVAPQSAEAWAGLGEADVAARQNYDQALDAFRTAARLAPGRTDFLPDYAAALRQQGRMADAEALLRRRVAAAPGDGRSRYLLAGVLLDYDSTDARLSEAQAETEEAMRLAPQSRPAQQQMAAVQMRLKKPRAAMAWLQKVLAADPSNVSALLLLANASQQAGLVSQARQAAQRAASLSSALQRIDVVNARAVADPSALDNHRQLAALYARSGQADKARQEQEVVRLLQTASPAQGRSAQSLAALVAGVLPRR